MIKPNDLGEFTVAENCQRVDIDSLVRVANKELKRQLLQSQIEVMGYDLSLTTSHTRFNGERYWFVCPHCTSKVRIIYRHPISKQVGCRKCLRVIYKKQRFKGMIEESE